VPERKGDRQHSRAAARVATRPILRLCHLLGPLITLTLVALALLRRLGSFFHGLRTPVRLWTRPNRRGGWRGLANN